MAVSTIVRRTKTRWYLATNALFDRENGDPCIDWNTLLADVRGGTKHQRNYLIRSVKGCVEAFVNAPRDRSAAGSDKYFLSHGTVLNWYWEIRKLVVWMTGRGVWRFSALSGEDIRCFMNERKLRSDRRAPVSRFAWYFRVNVLSKMWALRTRYVAPLRVNPKTLEEVASSGRAVSSWKAIDEPAALALVNDALVWIENHGSFILDAMDEFWEKSRIVGLTNVQKSKVRARFYADLEGHSQIEILREKLGMPDESTYRVLRLATTLTKGACVVVVLFLIGLRIGEFSRLDHDCVVKEVDSNGIEVVRIRGIAAKQNGRQRSWIACEEVALALGWVLNFTAKARAATGRKSLWLNHKTGSFFAFGMRVRRTDAGVLTEYMKRFADAKFRSVSPPIQRIHPHRARKTFARFVVLRNKSALGALARHYGHVSSSITDGAYVGFDVELEKMLSEEGRKDLADNLINLLSASNAAGKASKAISNARSLAPAFKGRKGLERFVEKLIDDGVQLAPCDWGYCVYVQALSACHGDARGPDETRRSPDVCSTCANFVATDQHRPWWEQRLQRDDEFLDRPGLSEQTVIWVRRRRANSAKIVADLLPNRVRKVAGGAGYAKIKED